MTCGATFNFPSTVGQAVRLTIHFHQILPPGARLDRCFCTTIETTQKRKILLTVRRISDSILMNCRGSFLSWAAFWMWLLGNPKILEICLSLYHLPLPVWLNIPQLDGRSSKSLCFFALDVVLAQHGQVIPLWGILLTFLKSLVYSDIPSMVDQLTGYFQMMTWFIYRSELAEPNAGCLVDQKTVNQVPYLLSC